MFEAAATLPLRCLNCDGQVRGADLFCTALCQEEAKFVRYYRACAADGRIERPDVIEAIDIKLAMLNGGGYPERERRLSRSTRAAVIGRDLGRCRKCGEPGNQIDHISGNSGDLANLQLLCAKCHNEKTIASFVVEEVPVPTEPTPFQRRLTARYPLRLCDQPYWKDTWRTLLKARKKSVLLDWIQQSGNAPWPW